MNYADRVAGFAREQLRLATAPFVPEIQLYQADPAVDLWALSAGEYRSDEPPPFWAFAWPGGQALARYLLDHPGQVAGARVLDVGSGSGVVAVAAVLAGAASVRASDVDPFAVAAIARNAAANGVVVQAVVADVVDFGQQLAGIDVVLAGDAFYTGPVADRMFSFARRAVRAGAAVVVADADRGFLPSRQFEALSRYDVPTATALEGAASRPTTVWRLRSASAGRATRPSG